MYNTTIFGGGVYGHMPIGGRGIVNKPIIQSSRFCANTPDHISGDTSIQPSNVRPDLHDSGTVNSADIVQFLDD